MARDFCGRNGLPQLGVVLVLVSCFFFSHGPNFCIYSELKQNRKNILYSDIDSVQFFYSETEIRKNNNHSKWILTKTRQKGPHEKNKTTLLQCMSL